MRLISRRADLLDDEDVEQIIDLHRSIFAHEAPLPELDYGWWWLLHPEGDPEPVAFCGVVTCSLSPDMGYLKRAGVLPEYRGHGLQRRMIRLRETQGRREGWQTMVTETTDNPHSANNLIRASYRMWTPVVPWGLKGALYWRKPL